MDTTSSQFCLTNRDNPLPSDPTTTTNESVPSTSSSAVPPPASSPITRTPRSAQPFSVLVRLVARATGIRAAAPALVRHATAVTDAERRCGISTPWPPNAATDRTIAPRLRGSERLSKATSSAGGWSRAAASRSSGWA
ncbi:Uncharacterised protein [Mycobacterium tuberculosis]|uniref:Uncharacterized protein n=1 Tax=Mycobacterium tuberculosis TaxID=1773 RepID=A0A0T7PJT4_MYCTX|nr:Uncharacterised protein [Mycobacterium tuberculosis]CFE84158.1 Uncharacterised protein [Mycobacterium tuberculosis]CFR97172.1 Uncharacterised protein [Mycobacterium tuberculosis]CKS88757.1 Uncharacterised protein [Mycobacterium tuberculosis]CKS95147.1 Uncharacterised protein [Mycobacterium tuberculosis]